MSQDTFLRRRDVQARTGLPQSSLYYLIAKGDFPKPIKLGAHRVAWMKSEVEQWMDSRIAMTRGGPGSPQPAPDTKQAEGEPAVAAGTKTVASPRGVPKQRT